jgi:hypothetical protein
MSPTELPVGSKLPEGDLESEVFESLRKTLRKHLVLKTDMIIMPLAVVCIAVAFLDKMSSISEPPLIFSSLRML